MNDRPFTQVAADASAVAQLSGDRTFTLEVDQAAMDRARVDAIRQQKTSDLVIAIAYAEPGVDADTIAAEIDRRIPVPDPRIGKLCRPAWSARPMRVAGVEPGGMLLMRCDEWPLEAVDQRVSPDRIDARDWLDG